MTFTQVFGGGTLDPAQPSYKAYTASTSITSVWPIEAAASNNIVAAINDISFSATSLTFTLPPANQVSVGYNALFNNVGSNAFTVLDNAGNTVITSTSGAAWSAYVIDNSTASGSYRTYQMGAGTSSASSATLAGLGIKAITTTLNQEYPAFSLSTTPQTLTTAHRAAGVIWTGGAGVFNFSALATLTSGWFANIINQGTGAVVLTPPSGTIDAGGTKSINPGESCIVMTDAANMFTIGFGQSVNFAFTYLSVSVAGLSGTYTLSGAELNITALRFTGAIAGALDIIVPSTVQQYWVDNSTTGLFTFGVRTLAQATPGVEISTGSERVILYCNATNVINAYTLGLSSPILISEGGTGASTASGARSNLNVPSTLDAFTYAIMFG